MKGAQNRSLKGMYTPRNPPVSAPANIYTTANSAKWGDFFYT
jgi:hypothetical protein